MTASKNTDIPRTEHFSTPLLLAHRNHGLSTHANLIPFRTGTGSMIEAFKSGTIDIGIGLTEAWVAGIAKHWRSAGKGVEDPYGIVGEYVRSPLRWAVVTGGERGDLGNLENLVEVGRRRGNVKVGVSRMGSGSHVMSTVLASRLSGEPKTSPVTFEPTVCGSLDHLIAAVNNHPPSSPSSDPSTSLSADFFMWEHYTTKPHWTPTSSSSAKLKHLGELPTPWNGWHITVRRAPEITELLQTRVLPALEKGKQEFLHDREGAIELICEELGYDTADARAWYGEVEFAPAFGRVNLEGLERAVRVLSGVQLVEGELDGRDFDGSVEVS